MEEELFDAVSKGNLTRVRVLLSEGFDPNIQDRFGRTLLHISAAHGYSEITELLLVNGADPNKVDRKNETPLYGAINYSHDVDRSEIVEILLENGADPNIRERSGWTPLHNAVDRGDENIVNILLKNGANPNTVNKDGETPLSTAILEIGVTTPNEITTINDLLSHGADPNIFNRFGETSLFRPSYLGYTEIVRTLLLYGADPTIANPIGQTPLSQAIRGRREAVIHLLNNYIPSLESLSIKSIRKHRIDVSSLPDMLFL